MTLYRVRLDDKAQALRDADGPECPPPAGWRKLARRRPPSCCSSCGRRVWWRPWDVRHPPAEVERFAYPLPDKPSIAVLPFINVSGDAEQDHLAEGLTDDLITELSKVSGLFVIARHSVFALRTRRRKIQDVAAELGVHYVLEGTLQRADRASQDQCQADRRASRAFHCGPSAMTANTPTSSRFRTMSSARSSRLWQSS